MNRVFVGLAGVLYRDVEQECLVFNRRCLPFPQIRCRFRRLDARLKSFVGQTRNRIAQERRHLSMKECCRVPRRPGVAISTGVVPFCHLPADPVSPAFIPIDAAVNRCDLFDFAFALDVGP
jgi:hypothetical protein